MSEIRNLTRNGETFYPLTVVEAVSDPSGNYIGNYVNIPEFVKVVTDNEKRILWAIKSDGSIYYGTGVPQQVIDYITEKIAELSLDEYEDIVAFLDDYIGSGTTLKAIIDSLEERKVDKEEGKGLIPLSIYKKQRIQSSSGLK